MRRGSLLPRGLNMFPSSLTINLILNDNPTPSAALRSLYKAFKEVDRKYSIEFFCRKVGISSKGNFSFMMNGQRQVPERYYEKLCEAFKLDENQSEILMEIIKKNNTEN